MNTYFELLGQKLSDFGIAESVNLFLNCLVRDFVFVSGECMTFY